MMYVFFTLVFFAKLLTVQVSATELNRQLLNVFPATYEGHTVILYSSPEKEMPIHTLHYTFEPPVYVNDNRTRALGRAMLSVTSAAATSTASAGADGHHANSHSHILMSYVMTWDKTMQHFRITCVDQDDTSVWSFIYNADGIVGDGFEVPEFETRTQGASLGVGNSFVLTVTMKKTTTHPYDKIPTYNEQWAILKAAEPGTIEPVRPEPDKSEEESSTSGVGIILVIFGCGFIYLAIYYVGWRRKRSNGYARVGGSPPSAETKNSEFVQTSIIF